NPDLGLLQNNGGPTETMALLPGSPAIGTGNVTGATRLAATLA
ncbi:MAG: choice-of-anchor Q domain-containing protein, partial [Isosphaeraceae bacterium]